MSVWFRHDPVKGFPGYSREQFLGHGDPNMYTGARNQLHVQMEDEEHFRTILFDGSDTDRYVYSNQTDGLFLDQTDPDCHQKSSCRRPTGASTDTRLLHHAHNTLWHQLVITTRPDGAKGYAVYVDGTPRLSVLHA